MGGKKTEAEVDQMIERGFKLVRTSIKQASMLERPIQRLIKMIKRLIQQTKSA